MRCPSATLAFLSVFASLEASAQPAPTPAPTSSGWSLDLRMRNESVEQDALLDANALTLRARLAYTTPEAHGFSGLVELEGVDHLQDDFNDSVNGQTRFAAVADPEAVELNRVQLAWRGDAGMRAIFGRQRIALNNARFIGTAGFRQNEQTFDALRLEARPFERAGVTYIYIDNVRRVFGPDSPQGHWRSDSHVIQADIDLPVGKQNVYALLLDFPNARSQSARTFGARWTHAWDVDATNLRLALEAAQQSQYRSASADFNLGYRAADLAIKRGPITGILGAELLEGDGARGFGTPLASLHPFQGWADVFVATPTDGVRDLYVGLSFETPPWPATAPAVFTLVGHDFADGRGIADYGQELDAAVRLALDTHVTLEAKVALFEGETPGFADRTKVWVALEIRY